MCSDLFTQTIYISLKDFLRLWGKGNKFLLVTMIFLCILPQVSLGDRQWSKSSIEMIQKNLTQLGYEPGIVDGLWGKKTSYALTEYFNEYEEVNLGEELTLASLKEKLNDSYLNEKLNVLDAARFENRIGFGAPDQRVHRYVGLSRRQVIRLVVDELRSYKDQFLLPEWFEQRIPLGMLLDIQGTGCDLKYYKQSLINSWLKQVYLSPVPQFERISNFWLDHFSVAYDTYEHPYAFANHLNFVRNWKNGSFTDLLQASLSDAAMIVYLNNDQSTKKFPNENLAREFLELFSLGEGNYSEKDIRNLSLLLTGRSFNDAEEKLQINKKEHGYNQSVTLFGKKINNIKKLMKIIESQHSYKTFLPQKFYAEFISVNLPDPKTIRILAYKFKEANYDIISLFEAIISSKDFWSQETDLTLVKSPLELLSGTARTLNSTGIWSNNSSFWSKITEKLSVLGQDIFDPPSIDGWPIGMEWLAGQKVELRASVLSEIYGKKTIIENIKSDDADRWMRELKKDVEYKEKLKEFFDSAKKDQLMIETINISSVGGFRDRRNAQWVDLPYGHIEVVFHNVSFNDTKYNQITIEFLKRDNEPDGINLRKNYVSDNFLKNSVWNWHSDMRSPTISGFLKLPFLKHSNYASHYNNHYLNKSSSNEGKIVKLLIQAMSILYGDTQKLRFSKMIRRQPSISWLKSVVADHGPFVDVESKASPVRVFSFPFSFNDLPAVRTFNCNHSLGKKEKILDDYFMSTNDRVHFKLWNKMDQSYRYSFSDLLMPNIDLQLSENELMENLTSVAYNLK